MIRKMLVILSFLIFLLCLTSVNASDLTSFSSTDSDSLDLGIDDASSIDIKEIEDSDSISSIENDEDYIVNENSASDESSVSKDSSEVNSSEKGKSTSASKKSKLEDFTHMELDNDAVNENIKVGDLVTWILKVKNYGPNPAKNVQVFIQLSDGLKFVSYSSTAGSFDFKTGIWTIGNLKVNEYPVLKIITEALTPGEKFCKANLTSETKSTTPDECYEEEEIRVSDHSKEVKNSKEFKSSKVVSNILYPAGNPIAVLLVSLLFLATVSIKRKF